MSELCVFAGTTEGRRLAEYLAGQPVKLCACVATEYGETLIPQADNIEVLAGRLDAEAMRQLFEQRRFDAVIDATHPFATAVSENIAAACRDTGTEYLRLNREGGGADGDAVYVDSIQGAAAFWPPCRGTRCWPPGARSSCPTRR